MSLTANVTPEQNETPTAPSRPKTAPGQLGQLTMQRDEAMDRADAAEARAAALEAALVDAEQKAPKQTLPLDQLHEVEGRRRRLTDEQFMELVENLRNNELITPITVRPRAEGGYEVISGHNRIAAYRALGRGEIEAVIRTLDDERAIAGAFYANLLQPELPDYEKYLGFAALRRARPHLTPDDLADQAGRSRTQIHRLLSFGDLPEDVITILESAPDVLGANAAYELAKIVKQGSDETIKTVKKLIEKLAVNEISQDQAVRAATAAANPAKPVAPERPKPIPIKFGKIKYLTIRPTGAPTTFKLEFVSEAEASETMTAFQDWIKARLAEKKGDD